MPGFFFNYAPSALCCLKQTKHELNESVTSKLGQKPEAESWKYMRRCWVYCPVVNKFWMDLVIHSKWTLVPINQRVCGVNKQSSCREGANRLKALLTQAGCFSRVTEITDSDFDVRTIPSSNKKLSSRWATTSTQSSQAPACFQDQDALGLKALKLLGIFSHFPTWHKFSFSLVLRHWCSCHNYDTPKTRIRNHYSGISF